MGLNQPLATMPAQYAILLVDLVTGHGIDRAALLSNTQLASTGMENTGPRISTVDFSTLVNNALTLTGNPALGLELGSRINLSAHAVLGQAFLACETLEQVLDLFMRYSALLAPAAELHLDKSHNGVTLELSNVIEDTPLTFSCELFFASVLNTLRGLLYNQAFSVTINLPYPQPDYEADYIAAFGTRVNFDSSIASIRFDTQLLACILPTANPALLSLYETECRRLLADLGADDTVSRQVQRLLQQIEGQYPNLLQMAALLHLGERTLRRRLANEGTSYQQLLDKARARQAAHYLKHSQLPMTSIAYLVGFNDSSNFRRAYQRWTGETPAATRKNHHA